MTDRVMRKRSLRLRGREADRGASERCIFEIMGGVNMFCCRASVYAKRVCSELLVLDGAGGNVYGTIKTG